MIHRRRKAKLQRDSAHRKALLQNLASSLITHHRIQTTLAKAKALRPFVEKLLTTAKKANASQDPAAKLHYFRLVLARLRNNKAAAYKLVHTVAPAHQDRQGGYVRIYKLGQRASDAAPIGIIEFVDLAPSLEKASTEEAPATEESTSES